MGYYLQQHLLLKEATGKFMIIRILILLTTLTFSTHSLAIKPMQLISDAEIETTLTNFISPLVKAANLNPNNIRIYIVANPEINAFVANGTLMFINSGLIVKFADDPNILYGVMAHEIAHIKAGHLIKLRSEIDNMSAMAMGGTLLGLASALAGAPDAGFFIGAAANQAAFSNVLSFSRENETEADKIAIDLLYKTQNNGQGLIKLFQYLSQKERLLNLDPYSVTHPLSNERIASVKNSIKAKLNNFGDNIPNSTRSKFKRIANKLDAFLLPPEQVIKKSDKYSKAIGNFRYGNLNKAISLIDQVITEESDNSYLLELKGQFYFENGDFNQANNFYRQALKRLPNEPLIKLELAISEVNQARDYRDSGILNSAISLLKQVSQQQEDNPMVYYMLSRGYGKLNDQLHAILYLAEYYYSLGAYEKAKILAQKVIKMAKENSKEFIRANDILLSGTQ